DDRDRRPRLEILPPGRDVHAARGSRPGPAHAAGEFEPLSSSPGGRRELRHPASAYVSRVIRLPSRPPPASSPRAAPPAGLGYARLPAPCASGTHDEESQHVRPLRPLSAAAIRSP